MKTTFRCNPTDLTNVRGHRMQLYVNGRDHTLVTLASAHEVRQKIDFFVEETLSPMVADEDVTFVPIMDGAMEFMTDLTRGLSHSSSVAINSVRASRYGQGQLRGIVNVFENQLDTELICGKKVIVVDDLLVSGHTARAVVDEVKHLGALEVITIFLCRKMRPDHAIRPDFWLFSVHPSTWCVGKGMAHERRLRHLTSIYDVRAENYNEHGFRIS